jgi:catechol 2,3-dioxygenase
MTSTHLGTQPGTTGRTDRITYGAVHLDVVDRDGSLGFWRDALGLTLISDGPDGLHLGSGGRTLIVLHPGAARGVLRGHAGLYHVAVHVPTAEEFARAIARLAAARIAQAPTDHVYSMATYATAPDGINLEITLETPERFGGFRITPGSVEMWDADGRPRQPTEALDVEAVMARLPDDPVEAPLRDGAVIGHVHLHVPDLADAVGFYRDVLGFEEHMVMPGIGMADLSAGGRFPHRLAVNTWMGPRSVQPPAGTAGLRGFELLVADGAALEAVRSRAALGDGDVLTLSDPAGNRVLVAAAER